MCFYCRALHDDQVALELLPEEDWVVSSTKVIEREDLQDGQSGMTTFRGINSPTIHTFLH